MLIFRIKDAQTIEAKTDKVYSKIMQFTKYISTTKTYDAYDISWMIYFDYGKDKYGNRNRYQKEVYSFADGIRVANEWYEKTLIGTFGNCSHQNKFYYQSIFGCEPDWYCSDCFFFKCNTLAPG